MTRGAAISKLGQLDGRLSFLRPIPEVSPDTLFEAIDESRTALERFMPFATDRKSIHEFVDRTRENHELGVALELAVFEQKSGALCGVVGLNRFDPFTPKVNLGYWVRSSLTGRGLATDAVLVAAQVAREDLALARLDAAVAVDNLASQQVLRKSGFIEEGSKKRSQLCHGTWQDMLLFGQLL